MKAPETIFLIEQEGRLTFAVTRPAAPTITNDQIHEYSLIEQPAIDANLIGMNAGREGIDIEVEGGACAILAACFAEQFKDSGATNFLELSFFHKDTGPMTVTMQRDLGTTPGAKVAKMKELIQAGDIKGAMAV